MKSPPKTASTVMNRFAYPQERDLRFERTQPAALKRLDFPLDETRLLASVADGASVIACLVIASILFGALA